MAEQRTAWGEFEFLEGKRLSSGLSEDEARRLDELRHSLEQHAAGQAHPPDEQSWPTVQTIRWQDEVAAAEAEASGQPQALAWPTLGLDTGSAPDDAPAFGDEAVEVHASDVSAVAEGEEPFYDIESAEAELVEAPAPAFPIASSAAPARTEAPLLWSGGVASGWPLAVVPSSELTGEAAESSINEVGEDDLVASEATGVPEVRLSTDEIEPADERGTDSALETAPRPTLLSQPPVADNRGQVGSGARLGSPGAETMPSPHEPPAISAFELREETSSPDSEALSWEDSPMERTSVLGQPWETTRSPTQEFSVPSVWGVAPVALSSTLAASDDAPNGMEGALETNSGSRALEIELLEEAPENPQSAGLVSQPEFLSHSPRVVSDTRAPVPAAPDAFSGALVSGSLAELTGFSPVADEPTFSAEEETREGGDLSTSAEMLESDATSPSVFEREEATPLAAESGGDSTDLLSQEALIRRLAESLADVESTGRVRLAPPVTGPADLGPPPWATVSPEVPRGPQVQQISDVESGENLIFDLSEDGALEGPSSAATTGHLPPPTSWDDSGSIDISEVSAPPMPDLEVELGGPATFEEPSSSGSAAPGPGASEPTFDVLLLDDEVADEPPVPEQVQLPPSRAVPVPKTRAPLPKPLALVAPSVPSLRDSPPSGTPFGLSPSTDMDTAQTFVAGVHRVAIHTAEGQVKRGVVRDLDLLAPLIRLYSPGNGTPEVLEAERIKAIFFLVPPGTQLKAAAGQQVRVTFRDGRQVTGYSEDHLSPHAGFFLVPAENRANTARIYVYRSCVQSIGGIRTG